MNPVIRAEIYNKQTNQINYKANTEQPHPLPATKDEPKQQQDVQKEIKPKPDVSIKTTKWY